MRDQYNVDTAGAVGPNSSGVVVTSGQRSATQLTATRSEWVRFAAGCAAASFGVVLSIFAVPSGYWKAALVAAIAVSMFVLLLVLRLNPARFYRNQIAILVVSGPALAATGFTLEAGIVERSSESKFLISTEVGVAYWLGWTIALIALILADLRRGT